MSSGEVDLFFDSSSDYMKLVNALQSNQSQIQTQELTEQFPSFNWQESQKNQTHARIFAEEGNNLAEDSGDEQQKTKNLPHYKAKGSLKLVRSKTKQFGNAPQNSSPKSDLAVTGFKSSLDVISPNKMTLAENDNFLVEQSVLNEQYVNEQHSHGEEIKNDHSQIENSEIQLPSPIKDDSSKFKRKKEFISTSDFHPEPVPLQHNTKYNQFNSRISLFFVQDLKQAHSDSIWTARFSPNGRLLATGGKDATLKIWEIESETSVDGDPNALLKKEPTWEFKEHAHDIIDVSWHANSQMILSCSFDQKVILWSLEQGQKKSSFSPLFIYEHPDVPSQISFFKSLDVKTNYFVSGALDGWLRVWSIQKKSAPSQMERVQEPISALAFSPNGKWLVVGLITGMCILYECIEKTLNYKSRIDCKNRRGRFSAGRKISGLIFISDQEFLCQTADSRLRLYTQVDCIQRLKFKSHLIEQLQIKPDFDPITDQVISGSEDGFVYMWDRRESFQNVSNKTTHITEGSYIKQKQHQCATFVPFVDQNKRVKTIANVVIFCPKEVVARANQIKPGFKNKQIVKSVILVASIDGRIKIYWNEEKPENKGLTTNLN